MYGTSAGYLDQHAAGTITATRNQYASRRFQTVATATKTVGGTRYGGTVREDCTMMALILGPNRPTRSDPLGSDRRASRRGGDLRR